MKSRFRTFIPLQSRISNNLNILLFTVALQMFPTPYCSDYHVSQAQVREQYSQEISIFSTNSFPNTDNGGVIGAGDLDRDGHVDFIRAKVGWRNNGNNEITAYDWQGNQLWSVVTPSHLYDFKGGFMFGVVGDSDYDGDAEFHFVGNNSGKELVILNGTTGCIEPA